MIQSAISEEMNTFNIDSIRSKLKSMNPVTEIESIRSLFQEELMDWTDCYNETLKDEPNTNEALSAKLSIVKLWIEYGTFEKNLHQYKKAVQVFEDAIKETIAGSSCEIYIAFANYYKEREKPSSSKKQIIRGLCSETMTIDDIDKLWLFFLRYVHDENKSVALTINDLYTAVKSQVTSVDGKLNPPSSDFILKFGERGELSQERTSQQSIRPTNPPTIVNHTEKLPSWNNEIHSDVAESKDMESDQSVETSTLVNVDHANESINHELHEQSNRNNNHAVGIEHVDIAAVTSFINEVANETIFDDLDDLSGLSPDVLIRVYSERPPMLFSAPDKEPMSWGLSSVSASDITEIESFLGCSITSLASNPDSQGNFYLDILETLWMTQAFKERDFDAWFSSLKDIHNQEEAAIQRNLETAAATQIPELVAKAEAENQRAKNRMLVQREVLHAIVNRIFHRLLLEQEQCLCSIGFPRFNQDTLRSLSDTVTQALHTPSIHSPYSRMPHLLDLVAHQSVLVCACLSLRLSVSTYNDQNTEIGVGGTVKLLGQLRRMSSLESDRSGDWTQSQSTTKRKKRRRTTQSHIESINKMTKHRVSSVSASTPYVYPTITVPDISSLTQQHFAQVSSSAPGIVVPSIGDASIYTTSLGGISAYSNMSIR